MIRDGADHTDENTNEKMHTDYLKETEQIAEEIIEIRKAIHRRPEIGNKEYHTSELIQSRLGELGIETRRVLGTAVIGILRGRAEEASGSASDGKRRAAALRADMDALPLTESTGADFASEVPGMMHACGHDVHMAAVLGAAKLLAAHADELAGDVIFIFEPDEEGDGGALRLIDEGCLDGADAVFGAHVAPDIPDGKVGFRYGKFYAAANTFDIEFFGKATHGAEREKGADALGAAALAVTKLLALPETAAKEKCVITVGTFESGTVRNIVADRARITGVVRSLGAEDRENVKQRVFEVCEESAAEFGATCNVKYMGSYAGVVNDDEMTAFAEKAAAGLLGEENIVRIEEPVMITEDFGYYIDEVPGTFYHIGAGCELPLHNDRFLPTEKALLTAAAVHAEIITRFLEG